MGFNLNWLAVETSDKAALLARLGLREFGAAVEEWSTDCAYAVTTSGWVIIASEGMRLDLDRLSPAASKEGLALACVASEIVMVSGAEAWRDGARIWRVGHDPEQGVESLQISGAPPPELAEIADRLAAEQAAADVRHADEAAREWPGVRGHPRAQRPL